MLRLVAAWFPPRRVPVVTQLTGLLGQLGQLAAAIPLVALLHVAGWTTSFLAVGVAGLGRRGARRRRLRDAPPWAPVPAPPQTAREVRRHLRAAWREPGTRLGLWTHFATQFSGTVFALLWGYPFLVAGEDRSPGEAARC